MPPVDSLPMSLELAKQDALDDRWRVPETHYIFKQTDLTSV
jgi:hypothetical protein